MLQIKIDIQFFDVAMTDLFLNNNRDSTHLVICACVLERDHAWYSPTFTCLIQLLTPAAV